MIYATKDDVPQLLCLAYRLIVLIEQLLQSIYMKIWMVESKEHIMLKYDVMLNKLCLYNEMTIPFYSTVSKKI